jgi:hypothetical protein
MLFDDIVLGTGDGLASHQGLRAALPDQTENGPAEIVGHPQGPAWPLPDLPDAPAGSSLPDQMIGRLFGSGRVPTQVTFGPSAWSASPSARQTPQPGLRLAASASPEGRAPIPAATAADIATAPSAPAPGAANRIAQPQAAATDIPPATDIGRPPNIRPPDPGGDRSHAPQPNGAPAGAVFDSGALPQATPRIGYGDQPTGVPIYDLARQTNEQLFDFVDQKLDAYRRAPTAAAGDQALDEALDAAYAHRIQGGDGTAFDRILAQLTGDPRGEISARVVRRRADQLVDSGASGHIRALNRDNLNFGAELQALQRVIENDPDNAYGHIAHLALDLKLNEHLLSTVPMKLAFGKLMTRMGYGPDLSAANAAIASRSDEQMAQIRAARTRMTIAERHADLTANPPRGGPPWSPEIILNAMAAPPTLGAAGVRAAPDATGPAQNQTRPSAAAPRGPPAPQDASRAPSPAQPASGAPSGAASVSGGQYPPATFGQATTRKYRTTFFDEFPEQKGQVVVHHAVEQYARKLYDELVSDREIHSLQNLRGIPKPLNSDLHLKKIRLEWNRFYIENPSPTKEDLLKKATEIDDMFGHLFTPPVRPAP